MDSEDMYFSAKPLNSSLGGPIPTCRGMIQVCAHKGLGFFILRTSQLNRKILYCTEKKRHTIIPTRYMHVQSSSNRTREFETAPSGTRDTKKAQGRVEDKPCPLCCSSYGLSQQNDAHLTANTAWGEVYFIVLQRNVGLLLWGGKEGYNSPIGNHLIAIQSNYGGRGK